MKRRILLAAMAAFWPAQPLFAAEPAYLDDRSTPQSLVRSLYNAINRQEYARAYAYFDPPPAETLEAFAEGYADTAGVDLVTGTASEEGAAGSIYYALPVAIRARHDDGGEEIFAGCYQLRLIQPSVQTTPYQPLFIEEGALEPAEAPLEEALPESCGDGTPVEAQDAMLEEANALFTSLYADTCNLEAAGEEAPESHVIRFNRMEDPADAPQREARLFRFLCERGAYNEIHVYFLANEGGELLPLRFATPELDIRYENDDPAGRVEDLRVIGYTADDLLVNSRFDPDTFELVSDAKWRGAGDASSSAIWLFRSGVFTLVKYAVDASYDGEINPEVVLDFHTGP